MLYTAWYFSNQEQFVHENAPKTKDGKSRGYRPAHKKHPMTMWVGSSLENYLYACRIGIALTLEEKDLVISEAKEIVDVEEVIASIMLVEDLRIQRE